MDDKQHDADQEFDLKEYLQIRFQEIQSQTDEPDMPAPDSLKKEVFATLDTIQLVADVTDLFTVKFTKAESQLIDLVDTDLPSPAPDANVQSPDKEND